MQIFYNLSPEQSNTAVALGFFDGVHRGHRKVLSPTAKQRENGLTPVCFTFAESPKSVIAGKALPMLMTRQDKLKALRQIGMEHVFFADFRAMIHLSARAFFETILMDTLHAKQIFCGFNYRFGKNAEGDTALLQSLCDEYHVKLRVIPPETDNGEVVCSTLIKQLIAQGNVKRANALLCSRFGFEEVITHGKHLGHKLGTPTINQPLVKELAVPKFGVYASLVTLENGEQYCGVTNVGVKPTVDGTKPLWETWMPDYHGGDLYGQTADIRLLDFIRDERKFDNLDKLKAEILKNSAQAKTIYQALLTAGL